MMDRVMAVIALLMLGAFLLVVPLFVPHIDLMIAMTGCAVLATYDMWRHLALKRP
ncbi:MULTISPECIES: hypothetical protein [Spiribacter]|uniref:hypothetical protein n=1 Tax=Spiribacter TaxID=1335745 RepID=UPI001330BCDB|nr:MULTISPECIES: hypothetical protein [Spiribacter]